jgi:REP element-mobilizing transposase RayT
MPQAYYRNYQHIVFSTKERRRSLHAPILAIVEESTRKTCRDYGVTILEMNGTPDHLHLLLNIPPKHAVSNIVRAIKGNSSIMLNDGGHLFAWQAGYSAFSVSESNVGAVRGYICGQEKHHRRSSFDDEFVALLRKHGIQLATEGKVPSGQEDLPDVSPRAATLG